MMQDVLGPLSPSRALEAGAIEGVVLVRQAPVEADAPVREIWIEGLRVERADAGEAIDLTALLRDAIAAGELGGVALTVPADPDAAYADAVAAASRGDTAAAGAVFLTLALSGHRVGSALHGLASVLCGNGRHAEALSLALMVGSAGFRDPRAYLLAGFSAYKTGNAGLARRCLAQASRLARGMPQYAEELRFAQRLLLIQQFGE